MPYERKTEFVLGATYIGKVSKYGARWIDINGHPTIQFTLILPSSQRHESGRVNWGVRITVFGGVDLPRGNDYVRCTGLPFSKKDGKGGIWNSLLVRGAENIEILSHWVPKAEMERKTLKTSLPEGMGYPSKNKLEGVTAPKRRTKDANDQQG